MNEPQSGAPARVSAASALLDRGWGKPKQALTGGDEDDEPIKVLQKIERLIVNPPNPDSGDIPPAA